MLKFKKKFKKANFCPHLLAAWHQNVWIFFHKEISVVFHHTGKLYQPRVRSTIARDYCFTVGWTSVTVLMKIAWGVSMLAQNVAPISVELNVAVTASGYMSRLRLKEEKSFEISTLVSAYAFFFLTWMYDVPCLNTTNYFFYEIHWIYHNLHD